MLIYIEDYLNRRRQSQAQARPLLIAAGGTATTVSADNSSLARPSARIRVLPLAAPCYDPALSSAIDLGNVYAEATLV
ncbi:MAG: hypothetical protein GEV05_10140 [Betaproteobacteria bacterium]|nr:hypothetical protein [Betaproteobacteria bacterium]